MREDDVERLRDAGPDGRRSILAAESGLPGPRANLPLAHAVERVVDLREALALATDDDEYLALCGTLAVGARADGWEAAGALRRAATDPRWRVREGVALGLQVLGGREPDAMLGVLDAWRHDPDPLVQRARVAAVCEPPLLRDPRFAATALAVCAEATAAVRAAGDRRADGVRVLRRALGYGWSVAVAADPAAGLPLFRALDTDPDPDVAWIVRANRAKARLARLL